MFKRLLVLALILGIGFSANAALRISVNGVVDPQDPIVLAPSDTVELDITGDGLTEPPAFPYLLVIGPGSIHGYRMLYTGNMSSYRDLEDMIPWLPEPPPTPEEYLADFAANNGIEGLTDLSAICLDATENPPSLTGTLVDQISFHCEGPSDVLIRLVGWDDEGVMYNYDTQVIHQIPEPVTIALLGLGGLLLRRRMA